MTSKKLSLNQKILLPGQIIGNDYEIIKSKIIGDRDREQFITSYLVKERNKENSLFVLELIDKADFLTETKSEEFFLQQVGLIKKLSSHVQIPKLRAHFREDSGYYIVYEYVRGELLASILKQRSLNESEVVNLLQDVARIYDLVIKSNIVNFNLLPSNILKSQANQRYVLGNLKELFFSQQTTIPLTIEEQRTLFQSQLQSLGQMLIQCLIKEVDRETIPVDWHKRIKLSPRLQNILAKMIAVAESDRYNSFQETIDDCQPLLKIDRVIGERYRLMRYLGEKNGVQTYLARNIQEKKPNSSLLIVKQAILAHSPRHLVQIKLNRLQQEIAKLQQLSLIKGIDSVIEKSEKEELYYIRSYVEGISLTKKLNQQKLFPPEKAILLLKKILTRLSLIHQQGLIHRNLKPSNIIVSKDDGAVFLVDIGILQSVDEASEHYHKYISIRKPPEQIVGRPTPSSDIYALGIITIEMLTGLSIQEISLDPLFEQETWRDRLSADSALILIIERMICLDVEKRYQSTKEVLQDLERLSYSQGEKSQLLRKIPLLFSIARNRNWLVAIAMAGILLGIVESIFPFIRPQYYIYRGSQQLENQPKVALNSFERALRLRHQLAKAWVGKGNALLALNSPQSALEAYERATSVYPSSAAAWEGKGDVFSYLGNLDRAITTYNKALELKPEDTATEVKQGKTLYQLSRYEEAFSIQEQAIAQNATSNVELLSDAGRSALALGKNNQALSILSRVESTAPSSPHLWQDKVTALRNLNRPTEALESATLVIESYDRAFEQQPQNIQLWLGKGAFLEQLQLYERALEAYDRAIAITPNSDLAWLGISQSFLALQEYDAALESVAKTLEIKPNSFRAWHIRGLILQEQQDLESALTAYDRSIEINPDFFPSWRGRAAILIAQNNYSEGIKSLQKAIALAPQDVESWLKLSDVYQSRQQIEAALDALDKVIVLQPRNSDYWLKKGSIWEEQQEYTKACDIYRQAIQIAPSQEITATMQRVGCRVE